MMLGKEGPEHLQHMKPHLWIENQPLGDKIVAKSGEKLSSLIEMNSKLFALAVNANMYLPIQVDPPLPQVISYYFDVYKVRQFVDMVIESLAQPVFLPVYKCNVGSDTTDQGENQPLDAKLFILVHAVQILLFAPMDLNLGEMQYSRDTDAYPHRFPSPKVHAWEQMDVAGRFSGEDLYRACCLFVHTAKRRGLPQYTFCTTTAKKNAYSTKDWPGYCDTQLVIPPLADLDDPADLPHNAALRANLRADDDELQRQQEEQDRLRALNDDHDSPGDEDASDDAANPVDAVAHLEVLNEAFEVNHMQHVHRRRQQTKTASRKDKATKGKQDEEEQEDEGRPGERIDPLTFSTMVATLRKMCPSRDPDEVNAETQSCLTHFNQFVDTTKLAEYLRTQEDVHIQEGATNANAANDAEAQRLLMARCFAMNSILNDPGDDEVVEVEAICKRLGFDYPQLKPSGSTPQATFKPHQVQGESRWPWRAASIPDIR